MSLFWSTLGMVFLAEMGDKTQILMIAMASKFRVRELLPGVGIAVALLNALAVGLGTLTGRFLPENLIGLVAGAAFLYFAFTTVGSREELPKDSGGGQGRFAVLAVATTFFLAELGDKTQLTALTVAAEHGVKEALPLFLGASVGLFGADLLGFLLGVFLGRQIPASFFAGGSFLLFSVFGLLRIHNALYCLTDAGTIGGVFADVQRGWLWAILIVFAVGLAFFILCACRYRKVKQRQREKLPYPERLVHNDGKTKKVLQSSRECDKINYL